MGTAQDWGIAFAEETSYGVAPASLSTSLPVRSAALNIRRERKQRDVYRVGMSKVEGASDSVVTKVDAAGPAEFQLSSRSFGKLWKACLGAGSSTLVEGTTYQQNFTLGDSLPSLAFQELLPSLKADLSGFDLNPFTFLGSIVEGWELTFPNADLVQLKVDFDCKGVSTTVAAATPVYADRADDHPFHFGNFCLFTGAFTAPTATTLAVGGTQWARAKSLAVKVSNGLTSGSQFACTGKGKPMAGRRVISGTVTVEYVSGGPAVDAIINDSVLTLVGVCGTDDDTVEKLQIAIPAIKLGDELPKSNRGDVIELTLPFQGLVPDDDGEPLYVIQRTYDTAI